MHGPSLTKSPPPLAPRGLVLMLHGGAEHGADPIDESSLSWRRSRWMMRQIERRLHAARLEVWLLRYSVKGWNAHLTSPVPDARWALAEVRREHPTLPVALLGHSMGGRTAAAVADDPAVVGAVVLAPWFPRDEPVGPLTGKHLVAAHGRRDRITRFKDTDHFVRRAKAVAASATLLDMEEAGHYMVRRSRAWNSVATEQVLALLVPGADVGYPGRN